TLTSIEVGKDGMLRLDTGEVLSAPEGVRDFDKAKEWMPAHEADIVACWDGGGRGLRIVGGGLALSPEEWDASPKEVIESIESAEAQLAEYERTIPGFKSPTTGGFGNLWAEEGQQPVYFIRTRKGTPGVLQIMKMTKDPLTVTFRYKLLTEAAKPVDDSTKKKI